MFPAEVAMGRIAKVEALFLRYLVPSAYPSGVLMAEAAGRCWVGAHSASGTKQRPRCWMFYAHLGDRPSQREREEPLAARQIGAADVSVAWAHRRPGRTRLRGPARVPMMETAD